MDVLTAVSNKAAARFWCNVHDFAAAHRRQLPAQLADPPIPAGHPFLAVDGGVLRAQLPVDVEELVAWAGRVVWCGGGFVLRTHPDGLGVFGRHQGF